MQLSTVATQWILNTIFYSFDIAHAGMNVIITSVLTTIPYMKIFHSKILIKVSLVIKNIIS